LALEVDIFNTIGGRSMSIRTALVFCLTSAFVASAQEVANEKIEFFESRVRPVLVNNCYACHTDSKLGGLRVDSRVALLEGGKSGPAIKVGHPEDSLLIKAVSHTDPNLKMPMGGNKLKDNQIADLKYWIQTMAAFWPTEDTKTTAPAAPIATAKFTIRPEQKKFWSFQPIHKSAPPAVKDTAWVKSPIDNFILAKLEEKNLKPSPAADKRTLIRRAYFDLTGLPPTPDQVEAFVNDPAPDAFAKVVDRLLASPQYGERWARHWLDVARYADGTGRPESRMVFLGYGMARDGYANTWRYRDWVVDAFNNDMPYDQFVKAQIAGDLMPEKDREKMLPGLGFFGIGPWFTGDDVVFVEARANERDDKIDALSKGFLGLTVTCARCHNHKYDPISQKDYYALGGVFANAGFYEYNLAPQNAVDAYQAQRKKVKAAEDELQDYADACAIRVAKTLAQQIPDYMMAVRKTVMTDPKADLEKVAEAEKLDKETLQRWYKYLTATEKLHPYLKPWDALMAKGGGNEADARKVSEDFRDMVLKVIPEKLQIIQANKDMLRDYKPDPNEATAVLPGDLVQFELFQFKQLMVQKVMDTNHFYVWLDVVQGEDDQSYVKKDGIFEYKGQGLLRFLTPEEKAKLDKMSADVTAMTKAMPPEYPYLMGLKDEAKVQDIKLNIRGNAHALGEVVPRGFPAILAGTDGDPMPFTKGSGRLELADAIVKNPLASRVMVNRIWQHHFGHGIVDTPSNFGLMGERPTHPELLDYLAAQFVEGGWSVKKMQRAIMLSSVYQEAYGHSEANEAADPENRLVWRANFRRLEVESLRDSLLFVTGTLDERLGGPPQDLARANTKKRTIYGRAARSPYSLLTLFDYPDPNITSEQREVTNVPLQGLFFLNSDLIQREAEALLARVGPDGDETARIQRAYRILYQRDASAKEVERGIAFLKKSDEMFQAAAKEPQKAQTAGTDANAAARRRRRPPVTATGDEDAEAPPAPAFPAGKMTPWQAYAQALLSSGEFYYVN
jgi:mono/diheme cytochrome c family protein